MGKTSQGHTMPEKQGQGPRPGHLLSSVQCFLTMGPSLDS